MSRNRCLRLRGLAHNKGSADLCSTDVKEIINSNLFAYHWEQMYSTSVFSRDWGKKNNLFMIQQWPTDCTCLKRSSYANLFEQKTFKKRWQIGHTAKADIFVTSVFHRIRKRTTIAYTLSRGYRVVRNRYSRLKFTSEDRHCVSLRV